MTSLRFRPFSSSSPPASPSPGPNGLPVPQPRVDLKELDVDGVIKFATTHRLDADDAGILRERSIDGLQLLEVTEEKLMSWGMCGGPAWSLFRAVEQQAPERWSYGFGSTTGTFVNREQEVAQIFVLNARNNFRSGKHEFQSYRIPMSSHLTGAGTTRLADAYIEELRNEKVEKEIHRLLKEMGREMDLEQYGRDELAMMQSAPVRRIYLKAGGDSTTVAFQLHCALQTMLGNEVPRSPSEVCPGAGGNTRFLAHELRQSGPVFLCIDKIGKVGDYESFECVRDRLVRLFFGESTMPSLYPLHIYVSGWTTSLTELHNIDRQRISTSMHHLVRLRPLGEDNIRTIAKQDYGLSISDAVVTEISKVTGGVPGMVRHILEALRARLPDQLTADTVVDCCSVKENDIGSSPDFVTLDDELLAEFARFVALEERNQEVTIRDRYDTFPALASILPMLAVRVPEQEATFTVRCCHMYLSHYAKQLEKLDMVGFLTGRGYRLTVDSGKRRKLDKVERRYFRPDPSLPKDSGEGREMDVLERLYSSLIPSLLVARQPEARQMRGNPVNTSLKAWLPSLFGTDDADANALEAVLAKTLASDLTRSLPIYFDHFNLDGPMERPPDKEEQQQEAGKKGNRPSLWQTVEEYLTEKKKQADAAAILLPVGQSNSPDLLVRMPPSFSLRLLSFKMNSSRQDEGNINEKSRTERGRKAEAAFGLSGLKEEARKLPTDLPVGSCQLLVVCFDVVTKRVERAMGDGTFLVLSKLDGEKQGEVQCAEDVAEVKASLQEAADLLPAGAIVALMAPKHFAKFAPKMQE